MSEDKDIGREKRSTRHGERGQAMLEFALTAPLLLILLLGLVEFGNGLNSYLTVVSAARDGARLGSQGSANASAIKAMIANETARLPTTLDTTASCDPGPGVCIKGVSGSSPASYTFTTPDGNTTAVYVRICYDHPLLIGLPFRNGPIRMCSSTTMRVVD